MNLFPSAYLVFSFFLILFIDLITLFYTIYGFHYTIQLTLTFFFSILSIKSFQFQLNKLFLSEPYISSELAIKETLEIIDLKCVSINLLVYT